MIRYEYEMDTLFAGKMGYPILPVNVVDRARWGDADGRRLRMDTV